MPTVSSHTKIELKCTTHVLWVESVQQNNESERSISRQMARLFGGTTVGRILRRHAYRALRQTGRWRTRSLEPRTPPVPDLVRQFLHLS